MAGTLLAENRPEFVWDAVCERAARFTKLERVPNRHLRLRVVHWPRQRLASRSLAASSDLAMARAALDEPGERRSYEELRKELGL